MTFPAPSAPLRSTKARAALAIGAAAICVWFVISVSESELRADLLQRTRIVGQGIEVEHVEALSGTAADLASEHYRQLKGQLTAIRAAYPQCRFVYLMGRKPDGAFFFYVDSESAASSGYSPPGQPYNDDTSGIQRVFASGQELVEGPLRDQWGRWVSALIPITDSRTNSVVAVLGMDIDARNWSWNVAATVALPVGLILLILIGGGFGYYSVRRFDASHKPVLQYFLPPLAAILAVLFIGAGTLLWQQYHRQLDSQVRDEVSDCLGDFQTVLGEESRGLAAAALPIAADPNVRRALREGDPAPLLAAWKPFFDSQNARNHLTHMYFTDKNRVCLLRVHKPDRRGDQIDRYTMREAERTRALSSGLELGTLGTFTLRVVQPVIENGELLGYLELGKEIEDILRTLNTQSTIQVAAVIYKEHLNRASWEDGMRMLGRTADWERLPKSILISAPRGKMTDAFATWAEQASSGLEKGETDRQIKFNDRDWWVSAIPLQDVVGQSVGHLQVMLDITAQKTAFTRMVVIGGATGAVLMTLLLGFAYILLHRTDLGIRAQQMALQEIEERYRTLFDRANYGIVILAMDGRIISVNEAMAAMHGYRVEEMLNRSMTEFDTQRVEIGVGQRLRQLNAGEALTFQAEHFHKNGGVFPVDVSASKISFKGESVIQGFHQDITERKRAEDDLRRSERKYRELVEHANSIILHWTSDGRITFLNEYGQNFFGYSESEIIGRHVMDTLVPESDSTGVDLRHLMDEICANPQAFEHNLNENIRRNGERVWVDWTNKVNFNDQGRVVGILSIGIDVTARKQAEAEKERLEAQLQQAQRLEAVGQLAGGVAHDFNNLLQVILGYTALEQDRLGPNAPGKDSLAEIHKAAVRAADLTRQLLTFSRRQIIQPVDMNLNDLAENALKMIRRLIGEHIELRFSPSEPLATVHVDKGQLEQVLMNLCVNARDAMPKGGTLAIATRNFVIDNAYCNTHPEAKPGLYVLLRVSDTGHGMDQETCAQIFEPFFTTKGLGQGTGLGLATVYGIVKQHDGLIQVDSKPDEGTSFSILIPSVERPAAPDREPLPEPPVVGGAETILVAEDEEGVRGLISQLLMSEGYTVLQACDGEEAVRLFDEHADAIDLAVLDVMMPKLGGREVMERIRAKRPAIRFLFSSGYSESAIHTDFVIHSGLRLISKPYRRTVLLRAVREALESAS